MEKMGEEGKRGVEEKGGVVLGNRWSLVGRIKESGRGRGREGGGQW